ncbi:hypothetical protein EG328_006139 [Venturia inaequalis]|uniref:Uncharacterized protein n=1 Tax=Venturia inaequalis TaxID=5025 RepID=A0A8H3UIJ0_VENIN|nr:hypothetical protein EG328_006139 [Venturia inaequalis]
MDNTIKYWQSQTPLFTVAEDPPTTPVRRLDPPESLPKPPKPQPKRPRKTGIDILNKAISKRVVLGPIDSNITPQTTPQTTRKKKTPKAKIKQPFEPPKWVEDHAQKLGINPLHVSAYSVSPLAQKEAISKEVTDRRHQKRKKPGPKPKGLENAGPSKPLQPILRPQCNRSADQKKRVIRWLYEERRPLKPFEKYRYIRDGVTCNPGTRAVTDIEASDFFQIPARTINTWWKDRNFIMGQSRR